MRLIASAQHSNYRTIQNYVFISPAAAASRTPHTNTHSVAYSVPAVVAVSMTLSLQLIWQFPVDSPPLADPTVTCNLSVARCPVRFVAVEGPTPHPRPALSYLHGMRDCDYQWIRQQI